MPVAAIALGANLPSDYGTPTQSLAHAIACLGELGQVTAVSGFHITRPVGYLDQPDFTNAACLLRTVLAPLTLLEALLALEAKMGRVRDPGVPKGPRVVDLDLLLYDGDTLSHPRLTLPHPALAERAFVLEPLAEIAPDWVHPVLGRSIAALWATFQARAALPMGVMAGQDEGSFALPRNDNERLC